MNNGIFKHFEDLETYAAEPSQRNFIKLKTVDQQDRHAPHFLELTINQMKIWFSFDMPIAFKARTGEAGACFDKLNNNQAVHAHKAHVIIGKQARSFKSTLSFNKAMLSELKKEIIHTSSEVMRTVFGVD
uniref:Uncharacterized protein n=1 Tax=viral metagenome TaxID=1070528 RepID=A0A6M3L946_9ZZZZ